MRFNCRSITVLSASFALTGCITLPNMVRSEAGGSHYYSRNPKDPEILRTGVVNGLWDCDPAKNEKRLMDHEEYLAGIIPTAVRSQCQVRVGYVRGHTYPVPIPIPGARTVGAIVAFNTTVLSSEYVILPPGWKFSLGPVIDDGKTVNVGDIVEVRTQKGRLADAFVRLVRKCNQPRRSGERSEWHIGCRSYTGFNAHGYAGEKYYFSLF